ncbi:MAG: hypothetical protein Q8P25_04680 [Candidatus Curtissbacteria bacterium]|nr:hypothetical protein [Candidatus Curtissbacteria bacterium]
MKLDFKRCMTPHVLLHNLFGIGIGLILVAFVPSLGANAIMFGIVVVVAAFVLDAAVVK